MSLPPELGKCSVAAVALVPGQPVQVAAAYAAAQPIHDLQCALLGTSKGQASTWGQYGIGDAMVAVWDPASPHLPQMLCTADSVLCSLVAAPAGCASALVGGGTDGLLHCWSLTAAAQKDLRMGGKQLPVCLPACTAAAHPTLLQGIDVCCDLRVQALQTSRKQGIVEGHNVSFVVYSLCVAGTVSTWEVTSTVIGAGAVTPRLLQLPVVGLVRNVARSDKRALFTCQYSTDSELDAGVLQLVPLQQMNMSSSSHLGGHACLSLELRPSSCIVGCSDGQVHRCGLAANSGLPQVRQKNLNCMLTLTSMQMCHLHFVKGVTLNKMPAKGMLQMYHTGTGASNVACNVTALMSCPQQQGTFLSADNTGCVRLFDDKASQPVSTWHCCHDILALCCASSGSVLALGRSGKGARLDVADMTGTVDKWHDFGLDASLTAAVCSAQRELPALLVLGLESGAVYCHMLVR